MLGVLQARQHFLIKPKNAVRFGILTYSKIGQSSQPRIGNGCSPSFVLRQIQCPVYTSKAYWLGKHFARMSFESVKR